MPTSSERDDRIYCLPVPILKRTKDLAFSHYSCAGTAKKFAKKHDARAELLVCPLQCKPVVFLKFPLLLPLYFRRVHMHHAFLPISLSFLHNYNMKWPIFCSLIIQTQLQKPKLK